MLDVFSERFATKQQLDFEANAWHDICFYQSSNDFVSTVGKHTLQSLLLYNMQKPMFKWTINYTHITIH